MMIRKKTRPTKRRKDQEVRYVPETKTFFPHSTYVDRLMLSVMLEKTHDITPTM